MKAEFIIDTQELEDRIAQRVIKALRPHLNGKTEDDTIFTVKTLAKYLEVSPKWVYERIQFKEVPYFKIGGHVRFNKGDIDSWLDNHKTPAINPPKVIK